jgi:hypothetical protein
LPRTKASGAARRKQQCRPGIELLESRRLLAVPLLSLTPADQAAGYTLSTFATGFPSRSDGAGPLGIAFNPGGGVLVSDTPGNVRLLPTDTDGQNAGTVPPVAGAFYGLDHAEGLARTGNSTYLMMGELNQVAQINGDGTINHIVGTLPNANGVTVNQLNGHLFISGFDSQIFDVDPVAGTITPFLNVAADGLTFDASKGVLYAVLYSAAGPGNRVQGFDINTKDVVFDSGAIAGGPDGIAQGAGTLTGNLFVNTNGGTVVEVNLSSLAQTVIASGGSRGDHLIVDPTDNTLLVTQTDRIMRLTAPGGGGFAPPPGSTSTTTFTRLSSTANPLVTGQAVAFTAVVTATRGLQPQGAVIFRIDGVIQQPIDLTDVAGQEQATIEFSSLSVGTHIIVAQYVGSASFAPSMSDAINQVVRASDGPRVISVRRFGIHAMPTTIVLTFDRPLDPARADDLKDYHLSNAAGRAMAIRSATYDATAATVTLRPARRLNFHQHFVLTVNGGLPDGVADLQGVLLDGNGDGQPGSDLVTTVTAGSLVWPARWAKQAGRHKGTFLSPATKSKVWTEFPT